jgi:hypothetical protein
VGDWSFGGPRTHWKLGKQDVMSFRRSGTKTSSKAMTEAVKLQPSLLRGGKQVTKQAFDIVDTVTVPNILFRCWLLRVGAVSPHTLEEAKETSRVLWLNARHSC